MLPLKYVVFSAYLLMELNSVLGNPEIVSRAEWGARAPLTVSSLRNPVPYVVIHHSLGPAACYSKPACSTAMKSMQNYHMDSRKWKDIGYNFGAGSDGRIYMGRGWSALGAHTKGSNSKSIGICLIGDWSSTTPPAVQLNAVKALIKKGVKEGYIKSDYQLFGHRELSETLCPGDALFREIQTWPHWVSRPTA